jgi:DNA helicase-2/ATP-dependent DNA helicase PcrA
MGVPAEAYRLHTLDGWCMRAVSMFPARSGVSKETLKLRDSGRDYDEIRRGALALISGGHLDDLLQANYSRLIVDEYQDCSIVQHMIVHHASRPLLTCVLGDPLQTVFNFKNTVVPDWNSQVCAAFPSAGVLSTPWRWENAGARDLGDWLLNVRRTLLAKQPIDLSTAPTRVSWVALDGVNDHPRQLAAAGARGDEKDATVLIMGESKNPQRQRLFASQIPGAITVESVDLKDFVKFAETSIFVRAAAFGNC